MKYIIEHGWQEAVTCVRDLARWTDALKYLAGWSIAYRGTVDHRLLNAWHLPETAQGHEAVLVCPEEPLRWLRLVSLSGVAQRQIRSSGQAWETGGLFSLLVYCTDVQGAFERAQELGWSAYHDPVVMEFGGRTLLNVVLRGPDGCNFGLYQPLEPVPREPFSFPKLGAPFNGQQMVRHAAKAQAFYKALGWESWFSGELRLTCNNFGIPSNMVGLHPKHVAIMHAGRRAYGQVELVQWTGLEGRDFGPHAAPPNLGHVALRWPVDDLDTRVARLREAGVSLFNEPARCSAPPMGEVLTCATRTPDGAIIELVQPID